MNRYRARGEIVDPAIFFPEFSFGETEFEAIRETQIWEATASRVLATARNVAEKGA
jgi:hypothetical protein